MVKMIMNAYSSKTMVQTVLFSEQAGLSLKLGALGVSIKIEFG